MTIDANELMRMKKDIERKKSERDKLIGKRDSLLETLKDNGYISIEVAEEALDDMAVMIEEQEKELNKDVKGLMTKYAGLL